jgi:hypothetical protein
VHDRLEHGDGTQHVPGFREFVHDSERHEHAGREPDRNQQQLGHGGAGDKGGEYGYERYRQLEPDGDGIVRVRVFHAVRFQRIDGIDWLE